MGIQIDQMRMTDSQQIVRLRLVMRRKRVDEDTEESDDDDDGSGCWSDVCPVLLVQGRRDTVAPSIRTLYH